MIRPKWYDVRLGRIFMIDRGRQMTASVSDLNIEKSGGILDRRGQFNVRVIVIDLARE